MAIRIDHSPVSHFILNQFCVFALLCWRISAACANFPVVIQTISVQKRIHRGDARSTLRKEFMKQNSELRDLCGPEKKLLYRYLVGSYTSVFFFLKEIHRRR
jgi:hypothetical protein